MKDEIRKLFPLEFYINDKGKMVSEMSIDTLNKLSDEIIKLQEENDRHFKEAIRYENACDELEIRIDKAIEYIEEKGRLKYYPNELLNILKGEDKDE